MARAIRLPPNVTPSDTLLLKKVPTAANKVTKIFKHFKKYGRIKGIWCKGTEALVTFETNEAAKTAFESPEAYANNRFVRFLYPRDPEHAESKLSVFINKAAVSAVLEQVKKEIETANEEASLLRDKMKSQRKQEESEVDLWALLKQAEAKREKIRAETDELQEKMLMSPDQADEYDKKCECLQREGEELDEAIASIKEMIAANDS